MPDVTLRPLRFGEIIDQAVNLFRRLFVPLVMVQIICTGMLVPLQLYLAASGRQLSALYLLALLLNVVLSALASAAVALLISESYLGRSLGAASALKLAVPKIWRVVLLSLAIGLVLILAALPALLAFGAGASMMMPASGAVASDLPMAAGLVLGGLVLLLLPVAVFAGLAVSTPALVLEDLQTGAALRRSWTLTRGARLRTIGLLLVTSLLIMIPFMGIGMIGGVFAGRDGPSAASGVIFTVLTLAAVFVLAPLFYCVMTLLYYDLRVRKEAFDLQMLADSMAG
jgi:hypothetical protein